MNYFEAIWNELNGKFDWSDTDSQYDAITLYDDGQVVLLNEQEAGCIVIGTSYIDNIFHLPDTLVEILTTIGKVTVHDDGRLFTEQELLKIEV